MKFVFKSSDHPVIQGMAATLLFCGHEIFMWNKKSKSLYDVLYELKPNYLFAFPNELNDEYADACDEFKTVCIALQTPGIYEPFIAFDCLPACNPVQYGGAKYKEEYQSDIYVNSDSIDDISVIDCLYKYNNIKILGNRKIDTPLYLGHLNSIKEYSHVIKSTKVHVCLNDFERLNASFLGIDSVGFDSLLEDSFDNASTLDKLLADRFKPDGNYHRKNRKVLNNKAFAMENTFFHRIADFFALFQHMSEAQGALNKWESIRSEY